MQRNFTVAAAVLWTVALFLSVSLNAQEQNGAEENFSPIEKPTSVQTNDEGVAIDGYDPVAYFDQDKAVKGLSIHTCEYLDATWYFSSAENRDKFLANPEEFAPQYGGFCAHSLNKNKIVDSNPQSYLIRDNKLYLYLNEGLAEKDGKRKENIFSKNKSVRDSNWLTYQAEF